MSSQNVHVDNPESYVSDVDEINVAELIAPAAVVKNTPSGNAYGRLYPYNSTSKTKSTVVRWVLKTGDGIEGIRSGAFATVDIGGNCGFCRAYIAAGWHDRIMFAWEFEECPEGTKMYPFQSNHWYAFEQGRKRVTTGAHKGDDWVYLKINGEPISGFYAKALSRPQFGDHIYIEANENFEIYGYHELSVKFFADGELYKDQFAQKGFVVNKPADAVKSDRYFKGWYTAPAGGERFDFKNTPINEEIKLYARFCAETAKAIFEPENGDASVSLTVGQDCPFAAPPAPTKSEPSYEWIFTGWKNETTGKLFDFETDTIIADTIFTAQYREKEHFVSYYANGALVEKVAFTMSNPTVRGKEPAVPEMPNVTGVWSAHKTENLTDSMTVYAIYRVTVPPASAKIQLAAYNGAEILLNTAVVRDYLATPGYQNQSDFMRIFKSVYPRDYQDHQHTTFSWTDSDNNADYTVCFADNPAFENAYIVPTTAKSLVNKVGIFIPGKTYYWFVCGNRTGKCSAVDSFAVADIPVRHITAGKVNNMRDEGGYITQDGKRVKYGLVYRGASLDEHHSYVDDEARKVFHYLGIRSEIELRGELPHQFTGWDENSPAVFCVNAWGYSAILALNDISKADYKAVFEAMADKSNYPFYFHCSAGADRTGAFGYLLNGLLGVPLADLRKDYELTSLSEVGIRPADDFMGDPFDEMNRKMVLQYGDGTDSTQVAIENYLTDFIGVDQATLNGIKRIMLEKNPKDPTGGGTA